MNIKITLIVLSFLLSFSANCLKVEDIMKYIPNAREEIDQEVLRDFVK